MKIKLLSILAGVGMAMSNVQPALAQAQTEPIKFALCYDLSKVYAFAVPQVAQAALRAQQAADRLQRRAFASAVGAQQCHHGALRHIDRNALDGERYMIVDDLDIVQ